MTTLRDRLLALADDCELIRGDLVLAAARMALTDAMMNCAPPNAWDQEDCYAAIHALRDGLD